ncbi:GNAT family N-acetyltransferase [Amycolatopsis mongoliensis]|uniref:GNAT family N-acetyltransferase n=1 Tax=Amycolatopsis mongoliensis TaxID=715475 RepID=A0A9Y2JY14_9PSEU|nr:GNAT family N-acetyltransferase [Amycolatopsis sp. 4-36]WIY06836.1 GNAT family N-acetyltransferase [Amycolatopsis sp. 4-36]
MGRPEILRATPAQAGALTALMHASAAYQGDYASILDGYAVTPAYIAGNPTFAAMAGDELLGFYSLLEDPPELDILFVADAAQGLGLGARLIAHMLREARARGMRDVRVVSHPPALPFYLRMGARRTGTIPAAPPKVRWDRPELRFDVPTG